MMIFYQQNRAPPAFYWFPTVSQDMGRMAMDTQSLLGNSELLKQTFESFALSVNDAEEPDDINQRRHNALVGQQAFSEALFEHALKCEVMAQTYDSLAIELHQQVMSQSNRYTPAERTQLLMEGVKLRDLSNQYYEKYLQLSEQAHQSELDMYDEKLNFLRSKTNWKAMQNQVNKTSKVRYGFFDIIDAPIE